MIYGALGDIEEYRGMLKGLDVLIDWLEENDPAKLEVGSHPILGDKVFANVMAPTTRPEAEAHYETHQRYHDLQIDVEGREAFKVATGSLTLVQEFDEKDDYDLVDSDASIAGDLADDKFALFVAGEPHMPTLEFPGDGAQPVKKICFEAACRCLLGGVARCSAELFVLRALSLGGARLGPADRGSFGDCGWRGFC